jgi:hypothetical protein
MKHGACKVNNIVEPLNGVERVLLDQLKDARDDLKNALHDLNDRFKDDMIRNTHRANKDVARRLDPVAVGKYLLGEAYGSTEYHGPIVNTAYTDGYAQGVEDCLTQVRAWLRGLS